MSKFPLIEAMGLEVKQYETKQVVSPFIVCTVTHDYILASDLEKALEGAEVVQAMVHDHDEVKWGKEIYSSDTHTARLVCIQPIKKEPVKVEFESIATEMIRQVDGFENYYLFHNKLKPLSGKRVRVTVEEITEGGSNGG